MIINPHALARADERFGIRSLPYLKNLIKKAASSFWVYDKKISYDQSEDMVLKRILVDSRHRAYFVMENQTVVTVLTQEMAMNSLKCGKWVMVTG